MPRPHELILTYVLLAFPQALKKGKSMDVGLVATCIIVWGMMLLLAFLVLGTLRVVGKLRMTLGYLRFRLKQVEGRFLWRRGRDRLRRGQKGVSLRWRIARGRGLR